MTDDRNPIAAYNESRAMFTRAIAALFGGEIEQASLYYVLEELYQQRMHALARQSTGGILAWLQST